MAYPVAVRGVNSSRNKHACVVPDEMTGVNRSSVSLQYHAACSRQYEEIMEELESKSSGSPTSRC